MMTTTNHRFPSPGLLAPILLVLCALLCMTARGVSAQTTSDIDLSGDDPISLTGHAEVWQAAPDSTLRQALAGPFQPLTSSDVNRGITTEAFWVRTRLKNPTDSPKPWTLVHETSYLDNIQVFIRHSHQERFSSRLLSDRQRFSHRPVDYRTLAYANETPAGGYTDIYLKAYHQRPDSVSLQFSVYPAEAFAERNARESLVFGGYYGALLVIILLAVIVGALLRRPSVFSYGALVMATVIKWLMLNGYGYQYLWPEWPFIHNEGFHISFLAFAFFAFEFSKRFLGTAARFPLAHRLLLILQVTCILGVGVRFLGWYEPILHLSFGMLLFVGLLLPVLSAKAWRQGLHYARWYFLAWLFYSLGLLASLASAYWTIVPWGMQSLTFLQIGSLLESIFLAVAVTERLLRLETERRQALTLAQQDPLTGLGNRRLLQLEYERFREKESDSGKPLFLIMIDLDHFKQINDDYGHDAGDCVLKEVARLLKSHCRDTDTCIRYGGEEFALLLKADSIEAASAVAERVRQEFAHHPTFYNSKYIPHTLSCGITPILKNGELMSVNDMMRFADEALYEGKAAGRNCSVIARDFFPTAAGP